MKKLVIALCAACAALAVRAGGDFTTKITWENISQFCMSNVDNVKLPVKGIIVEHHGLGCHNFRSHETDSFGNYAAQGILRFHVHGNPWGWMGEPNVKLVDRILDLAKDHFKLGPEVKICSFGGSMGGQMALTWAQYTKHRAMIGSVVLNCPVTDLEYHYTERDDLPRTITSAFSYARDFNAELARRSPQHEVARMPDVRYFIAHSTADKLVNKEKHSDRFVAAMKKAGRNVTYVASEGTDHCQLKPEIAAQMEREVMATFGL